MQRPVVFMFAGQGSQYFQMGARLAGTHGQFKYWCERLDRVAQEVLGASPLESVWDASRQKSDTFDSLRQTHPAIFIVQYALCREVMERGIAPDFVLGASLGEVVAAAVSGALPAEDALAMVCEQAMEVERACQPGGMIAVLERTALYDEAPDVFRVSTLASVNYPAHFVVAAHGDGFRRLRTHLRQSGFVHQALPVRYAFHSAAIEPAAGAYKDSRSVSPVRLCAIPVMSPAYERELRALPPSYFWDVARRPVQFERAIRSLEEKGSMTYVDFSATGTLGLFVRHLLAPDSRSVAIQMMSPFGDDAHTLDRALHQVNQVNQVNQLNQMTR